MDRPNQILFKKTSSGSIVIGDVNPFINIVSEYFYLEQSSIPIHSSQFIKALQEGKILIVNGTEGLSNDSIKNKLDAVSVIIQEDTYRAVPPEKIKKTIKQLPPVRSVFELLGIARPLSTVEISEDTTRIIEEEELIDGVNSFLLKK